MCCGEKQGHESVTMMHGADQSDAREMFGCEEKHRHHAMPMLHGVHHSDVRGMCNCHERRFVSKKERIEVLEEYRESLKCELDGVEEELKEIKGES
jgi:hypothetical protein